MNTETEPCAECGGSGSKAIEYAPTLIGGTVINIVTKIVTCPKCGGSGTVPKKQAPPPPEPIDPDDGLFGFHIY